MSDTWLVVANASQAQLYEAHLGVNGGHLELLKTLDHPASRLKAGELNSDRSGHFQGNNAGSASYEACVEPKKVEETRFAHELAQMLESGRTSHCYEHLILVSSPHFMGLLRGACNDRIHDCITACIEKDYTQFQGDMLAKRVSNHIYQ